MDDYSKTVNLVPNNDFRAGKSGVMPEGWEFKSPYPNLLPKARLALKGKRKCLMISGDGNPDCIGWAQTTFTASAGKTYRMWARFGMTKHINPNFNLIFALYGSKEGNSFNEGIQWFHEADDGMIEGERRFFIPGDGQIELNYRAYFRYSAGGRVWIEDVGLQECEPIEPRKVRLMATAGQGSIDDWSKVLDSAAETDVDLVLLPETFNGSTPQPMDGPEGTLMSQKAREHQMYVAGTFQHRNEETDRVYNVAVLYDRSGHIAGTYRKFHPYSPESFEGVTPGTDISVVSTEFGHVGMIICYDSWFTDVTELLALKGADLVLFPSAGFYHSLMPARSADNGVRIVASSLNSGLGIWDTSGAEVRNPDADASRHADTTSQVSDVVEGETGAIKTLAATIDLNRCESPHNWGGPMLSAPGGRRNRRDQKRTLLDEIKEEQFRWRQHR